MTNIYSLQPFDTSKVITGQINASLVANIKYQAYTTGSSGAILIDENLNLGNYRKFISLYANKIPWSTFQKVATTEISELEINSIPPLLQMYAADNNIQVVPAHLSGT